MKTFNIGLAKVQHKNGIIVVNEIDDMCSCVRYWADSCSSGECFIMKDMAIEYDSNLHIFVIKGDGYMAKLPKFVFAFGDKIYMTEEEYNKLHECEKKHIKKNIFGFYVSKMRVHLYSHHEYSEVSYFNTPLEINGNVFKQ